MSRNHTIDDYDLGDGRFVSVTYNIEPGGFRDDEDSLTITHVLDEDGGEVPLTSSEEKELLEHLCDLASDASHGDDWRNEWE